MVSRWWQAIADLTLFMASGHWLENHEITQLAKITDGPMPISTLDYLALTWPGWLGFGISMLWFLHLITPRRTTSTTSTR